MCACYLGTRGSYNNGSHGNTVVTNEYDPSVQEAINRSLRDRRGDVTTETRQRPPPYNPEYHTRDSGGTDEGTDPSASRNQTLEHDYNEDLLDREIEIDRERERRGEISLDQLRLARIQRLSGRGGTLGMGGARHRRPNS